MDMNRHGLRFSSATGWRQAAHVNCTILAATSVTLLGCTIGAFKHTHGALKTHMFYAGTCAGDGSGAARVNLALHLAINVVSTAALASSSFFMQVLNAPSRREVDRAHRRGTFLGIGVPSVRNAFHVGRFKTCLLVAGGEDKLGYATNENADIQGSSFTHYGFNQNISEYLQSDAPVVRNISVTAASASNWVRISPEECYNTYLYCDGLRNYRDVVVVAEFWDRMVPADEPNSLWYTAQCAQFAHSAGDTPVECGNTCTRALSSNFDGKFDQALPEWREGYTWAYKFFRGIEYSFQDWNLRDPFSGYHPSLNDYNPLNNTYRSGLLGDGDLTVKYCLAEPVGRICHVGVSTTLLLAVSVCILIKTVAAVTATCILGGRNHEPLVTTGDVVQSFLCRPDPVTARRCLLGQRDARREEEQAHKRFKGPRQWRALQHRRWSVVPWSVWATSYVLFAIGIAIMATLLHTSGGEVGLNGSFLEGDRNAFAHTKFTFTQGVLAANSPQLLLSLFYLAYNSLFTRLQMAREWFHFANEYRPLRVTDPNIFLHWMLSNTLYLFISEGGYFGTDHFPSGDNSGVLPPNTAVAVGWSMYSLLTLLCVVCVLITIPVFLSFQRLPVGMVNVGSNSLAISASCHASALTMAGKPSISHHPGLSSSRKSSTSKLLPLGGAYSSLKGLSMDDGEADGLGGSLVTDGSDLEMQALADQKGSEKPLMIRSDSESYKAFRHHYGPVGRIEQFEQLSRSRIRWGVIEMPPEWYEEQQNYNITRPGRSPEPVGHLGFGVEEDGVKPPIRGHWYA
ncbi:hypothetical protein PG985_015701 [Apiospora marii]|uniref:uncharacterized protein n=1 Tax=Apiospora marii TaxID=335849 RepID=UPI00312F9539